MMKDFYESWWYLYDHPMFQDEYGYSRLEECMDISVVKVNPKADEIDNNLELNTKVQVWLEVGKYDENNRWHEVDLDCGGDTFEKAIITLANLIRMRRG